MKKNFFPMALMAIAMGLNACSSDDPVVNAGGGKAPFADGGYVKMAINMPSAPSSRADNDDFGDGLIGEYEVKNATLILFTGASGKTEDKAVFHSVYELPVSMTKEGVQITSTMRIASLVDKNVPNNATDQLYAYVVLNKNSALTYNPSVHTALKVGTLDMNVAGGNKTFGDFMKEVISGNASSLNGAGFLMCNAPLSDKPGDASDPTSAKVSTLVNITSHVYKSKAEAEAAAPDEVFVERALAKVTLDQTLPSSTGGTKVLPTLPGSSSTTVGTTLGKATYEVVGWTLDVTNKKSFIARHYNNEEWNKLNKGGVYRFVGSKALRTTPLEGGGVTPTPGSAFYRTYWAEDPNYNSYSSTTAKENFDYVSKEITVNKPEPETGTEIINNDGRNFNSGLGENSPLYCMENTFNVENMKTAQLTRAIVKVKFFGGKTFYTFNDDNTTIYDETEMVKRVKQAILSNVDIVDKIKSHFGTGFSVNEDNIKLTLGSDPVTSTTTFKINECDKDGKIHLSSFVVQKDATSPNPTVDLLFNKSTYSMPLNDKLSLGSIMKYKDGIAYYPINIKHFGDNLTPWVKDATTMNDNPYGSPVDNNKYLGRFGVLRNNWYNITVNSIKNVGSAVVPEIDVDNDNSYGDKPENYISVRINVLSWAKRNQSENL